MTDVRHSGKSGYRAALAHPVGGRLLAAKAVSELGDYVGLSALLLLAYSGSGSVLGSAAVFAAHSLPALLVATVFGGWLDRPPRRAALVALALAGGAVLAVPLAVPETAVAVVAASLLGGVRAAYRGVHTAVIAESVSRPLMLPLFGLSSALHMSAQVVGLAGGAGVTLAIGVRWALAADIVSFLVTAAILATLPITGKRPRGPRPPATHGLRIIWSHPTLRLVALTTWATFIGSTLPETVAPQLTEGPWLPVLLASSAAGGAVFSFAAARHRFLEDVSHQLRLAAGLGLALVAGAALLSGGAPVWAVALANAAVGAGGGWVIGAQATFARLAPAEHMGQVEATMVASNIAVNGVGILLLGGLAVAMGPGAAYLAAGTALLVAATAAARRHRGSGGPDRPPDEPTQKGDARARSRVAVTQGIRGFEKGDRDVQSRMAVTKYARFRTGEEKAMRGVEWG
ncbi:hypothetical protein Misp01_46040 [Microtetraspora sp. NBRC 13810]|uniref:MFS transporter n=1 Tax=Microtetraspora sp. NBRC 13810 TaxID=3030990 RepID=UPI0024A0E05D|nr:MFS transporter [Microtetraspora sp. NBRC 13810]GLW09475.1 hypothetical protein Misp01_46040 [Microtetraspora sp. NBRC 13810]